jgi:Tannase and feruloyl esterase.
MAGDLAAGVATLKDPKSYIPKEKYALLHAAVLQACDGIDGVKDGVLENPDRCHFDPKLLQCKDTEGPGCLTAPQVEAAKKIYAGAVNPRTGKVIFPGLAPGSELGWGALAGGPMPFNIVESHFKYLVFKDPNWDFRTLNLDTDVALADKLDANIINATDPNLSEFVAHGGKLLLHHGWNDQLIAPQNTIDYYNSVLSAIGPAKAGKSVRLFLAPGMNHCGGGEGPNAFDAIGALDQWVEKDKVPDRIVASHSTGGKVDRTRPLCPYPQTAKYTGTGSIDTRIISPAPRRAKLPRACVCVPR